MISMNKLSAAALMLAALMTALTLPGCGRIQKTLGGAAGAAPEAAVPVFAVNTTLAVKGQIRDYLALAGDIVAGSTVDAYSDVAGKVTRLFVSVGSRVTKNQRIAEVDPSRPGMDFLPGFATAPLAGTIVSLPAQVGMTVSQTMPIARISGGNALEIRLYVAERDISRIALAQPCEIILDAWPGEVFRGSVGEVSPVLDPASRTMEVRINVENPGSRLKPGMFAKVKIITARKNNIVKIPSSALMQRFGEDYLFVAEPDPANPGVVIAKKRTVTRGILIDETLEVQQGLAADEDVIIRGQTLLEDGARINIIDRVAPLDPGR
jgi:multidrug efflux pump subunit AcrA (membrane-fusion protein)